jgi:hypothetical protein
VYARVDSGYITTSIPSVVSVNELYNEQPMLSAYPNPVRDQLGIVFPEAVRDVRLELFDASGRSLWTDRIPAAGPSFTMPFPNLGAGIFFLKARAGDTAYRSLRIVRVEE